MPKAEPIDIRFKRLWRRVGECWLWQGAKSRGGYGRIIRGRTVLLAHRVSWELHRGSIPDGLCVLHDCPTGDNPACVNPAHLWLGTKKDNSDDMIAKGRQVILRGEQTGRSILTPRRVRAIRAAAARGMSEREICARFGISKGTRYHVVKRLQWRHVQ